MAEKKITIKHFQDERLRPIEGLRKVHPVYVRVAYDRVKTSVKSKAFEAILEKGWDQSYGIKINESVSEFSYPGSYFLRSPYYDLICKRESAVIETLMKQLISEGRGVEGLKDLFGYWGDDSLSAIAANLAQLGIDSLKSEVQIVPKGVKVDEYIQHWRDSGGNNLTSNTLRILEDIVSRENPKSTILFLSELGIEKYLKGELLQDFQAYLDLFVELKLETEQVILLMSLKGYKETMLEVDPRRGLSVIYLSRLEFIELENTNFKWLVGRLKKYL